MARRNRNGGRGWKDKLSVVSSAKDNNSYQDPSLRTSFLPELDFRRPFTKSSHIMGVEFQHMSFMGDTIQH